MARRETLRASDADREQVAERLRNATAEGRLLAEELEHRLGEALSARTYGQLDALVADLPRDNLPRRRAPRPSVRLRSAPPLALVVAIPIIFALVIAVVVIVASLFAAWAIAVAIGWWVFGHRRGAYSHHAMRPFHSCRRMHDRQAGAGAGRFWL
jgi:hypothetical protein